MNWCPECAAKMSRQLTPAGEAPLFLCPKCGGKFHEDPDGPPALPDGWTLGKVLADVKRSLAQTHPENADAYMAELDARMTFDLDEFKPPPDTVVVAHLLAPSNDADVAFISSMLRQHGHTNAVLILGPDEQLEHVDDARLAEAGLVRSRGGEKPH